MDTDLLPDNSGIENISEIVVNQKKDVNPTSHHDS